MEFAGKKVLVFGTGISGIAAAKLLENVAKAEQRPCRPAGA